MKTSPLSVRSLWSALHQRQSHLHRQKNLLQNCFPHGFLPIPPSFRPLPVSLLGVLLSYLLLATVFPLQGQNENIPAEIVVTSSVVAPSPKPFGLNQLNGRWGMNNIAYTGVGNGYEPFFQRERYFVGETGFGKTAEDRAYFETWEFFQSSKADGLWDGAVARVYRSLEQPDGVETYERVADTTVHQSFLDRGFWTVSFGLNESFTATAVRPSGQVDEISFRGVILPTARDFTDGRMCQFYQQTDLRNGTRYYYTVQAVDSGGNFSEHASAVSAVPEVGQRSGPRIITDMVGQIREGDSGRSFVVEVTNGNGTMTWSTVGAFPAELELVPFTNKFRPALRIRMKDGEIADASLAARQVIRIRVEDADGLSDERDIILNPQTPTLDGSDETAPAPPQNVVATALDGAVRITWEASPDADVIGYRVMRSQWAPEEQYGRMVLDSNVTLQHGDLIFVEKEFPTFDGVPELYHDRLYFKAFEGDPLWPYWRDPDVGSWVSWRDGYDLGYDAELTFDRVPHPGVIPAEFDLAGRQCVRAIVPADWEFRTMLFKANLDDGYFYRTWEPGKTYHFKAWVRHEGLKDNQVQVKLTGNTDSDSFTRIFTVPPGEWTLLHITDWTVTDFDEQRSVDRCEFEFTAGSEGATFWFDAIDSYEFVDENNDDQPDTPPRTMTPFWKSELKEFFQLANPEGDKPSFRYWGFQSNGEYGTSLDDILSPRLLQRQTGGQGTLSFPDFMELCLEVGADPWIIVSVTLPEEEWVGLLEYLAGDASTTYGARRIADRGGMTTPWTEEFGHLYIECDNETWNGMFAWNFGGHAGDGADEGYGQWAEMLFRAMTGSALWQSAPQYFDDKITFVVNGFNSNSSYGQQAAIAAPTAEMADVAPYLGGWESGSYIGGAELTDEGFGDWMLYAPWKHYRQVNGHVQKLNEATSLRPEPYRLGVYEGGPGYDLPGPNNPSGIVPESYGKSLAAAITTLDCYMYESYRGYDAQAFFGFAPGTRWTTHSMGVSEDRTEIEFRPQATWLAQLMRNRFASGGLVETYSLSVPTVDLPAEAGNPAAPGTPLIASYAFQDGNRYAVMLLSRKLDERDAEGKILDPAITPLTLHLPFTWASSISLHRIAGDPRRTNVPGLPKFNPEDLIRIESLVLDSADLSPEGTFVVKPTTGGVSSEDGTVQGLPPGCIYLYVFENVRPKELGSRAVATISRAPSQPLATFVNEATFLITFDRAVTGLTVEDLDFTASTVGMDNAIIELMALDPLLEAPLAYEVRVSGLSGGGVLRLSLPAAAVTAVSDGQPNLAASGEEAEVTVIGSAAIIDYSPYRVSAVRTDPQREYGGIVESDMYYTLDLTTPVFPSNEEQPIYGGVRATIRTGVNPSGNRVLNHWFIANAEGTGSYPNATYVSFASSGKNDIGLTTDSWVVYLWKKEDFYHIDTGQPLGLNAGSRLEVNVLNWTADNNTTRIHFLILDGGTFYLSETALRGQYETFGLSDFVDNPEQRWATIPFTVGTNDFSVHLDDLENLTFEAQSFTDVQAIGMAGRATGPFMRNRQWNRFKATVIENNRPQLALPLAATSQNVENDTVQLSLTVIDADTANLTYDWRLVSMPEGATPSFLDGNMTVVPAGEAAVNTLAFETDGTYIFEVEVSDGSNTITSNRVSVAVQTRLLPQFNNWRGNILWGSYDSRAGADPNGNGLSNWAEFFLARNPLDLAAGRERILQRQELMEEEGKEVIVFEFRRRKLSNGQGLTTMTSTDLAEWSERIPDGATMREEIIDPDPLGDGQAEDVRVTIELPEGLEFYFRLATPPQP